MNYVKLRKQIIALANLPRCEEPIISAYFNLEQPFVALQEEFTNWIKVARKTFEGEALASLDLTVAQITDWLKVAKGKSAAIFARQGEHPFFLPLTFKVPMANFFQIGDLPAIYPLVELKDRFNRFVVVLTTQDHARIIEMNLGETSLEMLAERPAIRERHGREWTREHYLSHARERDKKFVKEKVGIIEQLMSKRGHNAIIIAGEPRYVNRLHEALPRHLQEKVVDQLRTGVTDERLPGVLQDAIRSYLKIEGNESDSAVKMLIRALRTNGLAALGVEATTEVLRRGQADHLIISNMLELKSREALVRLASQHGVPIETVRNSNLLDANGSVGALLRYRTSPVSRPLGKLIT